MSRWDKAAVLEQAHNWCQQGQRVWLFHVLQTWGSSPRPPGSLMAMNEKGEQAGSVSGGCVETDLNKHRDSLSINRIERMDYDDTHSSVHLPCGGQLQLLVEPVNSQQLETLINSYSESHPLQRTINLDDGEISLAPANTSTLAFHYDQHSLSESYGLQWRLLLIGAEHLSALVARIAQTLEYQVIVCDPREEKRHQWQEPDTLLSELMPDDAVKTYADNAHTAVLTLSHDPKLDDMALMEAFSSPAFYIGALGSQRSALRRRQQLKSLGVSDQQLQALDAPIGLDIGSHSAAEIAVSICAKLIKVKTAMTQAQA